MSAEWERGVEAVVEISRQSEPGPGPGGAGGAGLAGSVCWADSRELLLQVRRLGGP
jgi:hypothetical protein